MRLLTNGIFVLPLGPYMLQVVISHCSSVSLSLSLQVVLDFVYLGIGTGVAAFLRKYG